MDVEILYLLNCGPKNGYEVKKQLFQIYNLNASFGTLYPHLKSMEQAGLISGQNVSVGGSTITKTMTVYTLTHSGSQLLRECIEWLTRIGNAMHFDLNKFDLRTPVPVKSNERESALKTVEAILSRRGYASKRDAKLKGVSGAEHYFEILSKRTFDKKCMIVHVADQRQGTPFTLDLAMKLIVRAQDIGSEVLLLALPNLTPEVWDYLNFHGATCFEGNDWQMILSQMLLRFDKAME